MEDPYPACKQWVVENIVTLLSLNAMSNVQCNLMYIHIELLLQAEVSLVTAWTQNRPRTSELFGHIFRIFQNDCSTYPFKSDFDQLKQCASLFIPICIFTFLLRFQLVVWLPTLWKFATIEKNLEVFSDFSFLIKHILYRINYHHCKSWPNCNTVIWSGECPKLKRSNGIFWIFLLTVAIGSIASFWMERFNDAFCVSFAKHAPAAKIASANCESPASLEISLYRDPWEGPWLSQYLNFGSIFGSHIEQWNESILSIFSYSQYTVVNGIPLIPNRPLSFINKLEKSIPTSKYLTYMFHIMDEILCISWIVTSTAFIASASNDLSVVFQSFL